MDTIAGTSLFEYDANDRIIKATYPDREESYSYDVNGNRSTYTMRNMNMFLSETYLYDEADRLLQRTTTGQGMDGSEISNSVTYTYDKSDNLVSDSAFT